MRIATTVTTAVCAATLTSCAQATEEPPAAAPPPTKAQAAPATIDRATLNACQDAQHMAATSDQAAALKFAQAARRAASLSDVPTLREIAHKTSSATTGTALDNAHATAAGYQISAWCITHDVTAKP